MAINVKASKACNSRNTTKPAGETRNNQAAKIKTEVPADETAKTAPPTGDELVADGEEVDAVEFLGKALREKVEAIRELAQRADCQEIELRFAIGMHCREVMDGNSFGSGAVEKLAGALGWAPSVIYDYASVARAWKNKEDAVTAAQSMNRGWRHLVEIASAPKENQQKLIDAVRDENLTVRELKDRKQEIAPTVSRAKPAPSLKDTTPSVSLVEASQNFAAALTYFEEHGGRHADQLAEVGITAQPSEITPEFDTGLREIRRRLRNPQAPAGLRHDGRRRRGRCGGPRTCIPFDLGLWSQFKVERNSVEIGGKVPLAMKSVVFGEFYHGQANG